MALSEAHEQITVALGDVMAALKRLGGVAHTDRICGLLVQSHGLDTKARLNLQMQVQRILAEHEASAQALVERVFGADSNRWRLN